jgi:hypothetical protein
MAQDSYITRVRNVAMLPGEKLTHVFSPSLGFSQEPPVNGHVLITTNQRILAFSEEDGKDETHIVPVEELSGVVVKTASRNTGSLMQGIFLVVGGLFIYAIVAYWFAGQVELPTVPIIRMDVGAIGVLLAIVAGALLIWNFYRTNESGSVTFQGSNWVFSFPFETEGAREQVYRMVNAAFIARRSVNGYTQMPVEQLTPRVDPA